MERLMDMALILFALAPLVAAYHGGSPSPLALSRLAGGLVGAGVVSTPVTPTAKSTARIRIVFMKAPS